MEGDWSVAPRTVSNLALQGTDYGGLLIVYLPEGWAAEHVGLNRVIHCPEHSAVPVPDEDATPRSAMPADRADDSQRYWGD